MKEVREEPNPASPSLSTPSLLRKGENKKASSLNPSLSGKGGEPNRAGIGFPALLFLLLLLLLASMILAGGVGQVHYTPAQVIAAVRHGPNGSEAVDITVWSLRLPRILMASLVGMSLALAGVAFQSLLRNDLADPYIIGASSGASVGAEAVLLRHGETSLRGLAVPLAAFVSAVAAMTVVYALARRNGRVAVTTLLLAGVIIGSFLGSVSTLMQLLSTFEDSLRILGRLMGSLQEANLPQCGILLGFLLVGLTVLFSQARAMNLFALGEESAQQMGVETERFKTILILTGSLLTAATVGFAGIIGFVGLMTPHIARRLAGTPDHRRVLPLATLGGAILMVWADTLARTVLPNGRELPVGIVTAFLGAPFFCILLRRQSRRPA